MREKEFGIWRSLTWKQYYELVRKAALGLEQIGLRKGHTIAVISDNIPEILIVAIGAQSLGAISAGIYQSSLPHEIADILNYIEARYVFCDDQEQVDKLVEVRAKIPSIQKVIYEDPRGMRGYRSDEWFVFIEDIYRLGEACLEENEALFDDMIAKGKPDDVCHLCLTSGTTGLPKGAMMTHRNYINMGVQITKADPLEADDEYMSFLPFAWIGEQMNSFGVALATGISINFPESVETIMADLKEVGPHFMFGAPRIYETIRSEIWLKIDESLLAQPDFLQLLHKDRPAGGRVPHERPQDAVQTGCAGLARQNHGLQSLDQSVGAAEAATGLYGGERPWGLSCSPSTRPSG